MAKEQNTILHRWFEEVWNNGRAELIDEMIAPNAIAHGLEDPNGNEVRGPEEFKKIPSQLWSSAIANSRELNGCELWHGIHGQAGSV